MAATSAATVMTNPADAARAPEQRQAILQCDRQTRLDPAAPRDGHEHSQTIDQALAHGRALNDPVRQVPSKHLSQHVRARCIRTHPMQRKDERRGCAPRLLDELADCGIAGHVNVTKRAVDNASLLGGRGAARARVDEHHRLDLGARREVDHRFRGLAVEQRRKDDGRGKRRHLARLAHRVHVIASGSAMRTATIAFHSTSSETPAR